MPPIAGTNMGPTSGRVMQSSGGRGIRKGSGDNCQFAFWWIALCVFISFFVFTELTHRTSLAIGQDDEGSTSSWLNSLASYKRPLPNNDSSSKLTPRTTILGGGEQALGDSVEKRGNTTVSESRRDKNGEGEGEGEERRDRRTLEEREQKDGSDEGKEVTRGVVGSKRRGGRRVVEAADADDVEEGGGVEAKDPPPALQCPDQWNERQLQWSPQPDRYLMMVCAYGRLCNRLWCITIQLVAAALMNRTLVFPTKEVDYDYTLLFDIPHINHCLGPNSVISLEDLKKKRNGDANVTMLKAFSNYGPPNSSWVLGGFTQKSGVHFLRDEPATPLSESGNMTNFLKQFNYTDEIISFGEGFIMDFGINYWNSFNGREPWVTNCTGPILRPEPHILKAALAFVRTYLGPKYLSIHWRRSDFATYCRDDRLCFYSIRQAAQCVRRKAIATDTDIIFVATDAMDYEFALFQRRLETGNRPMIVVRMPPEVPPQKEGLWTNELTREQYDEKQRGQTLAMLDRVICAMGSTYLWTPHSTFSHEIKRLRTAWKLTGCQDGEICGKDGADVIKAPWEAA
ncbi:hypothetical protein CBR_g38464 [Chara braunii]|uniref:Uncharacterized protein n=1 Tax=Chara braunii TaxID=69332 RepID=A0A388JNP1_CHABU|nr:hypothetical protein CBR_g38464 [Chara braunii]|eukprot:GBG59439.1 hypothetical protein CBR_g38464 [Chara braunii]